MNEIHVAVYGTLREGQYNYERFLHDAEKIGETHTIFEFEMFDLGSFPAIVPLCDEAIGGSSDNGVVIEVYKIHVDTLQRLDFLEGYPRFYDRRLVDIPDVGEAWVYFIPDYNENLMRIPIEDGDYVGYLNTRSSK